MEQQTVARFSGCYNAIIGTKEKKTVYNLDANTVIRMMIKMYALGELAWEYADTVLDIACQMKISETKRLSRAIRELRKQYLMFAKVKLKAIDIDNLNNIGQLIESTYKEAFKRLCNGLKTEIGKVGLTGDWLYLVEAVQMALMVIDVMKLFDRYCSKWLTDQGVDTVSILADHFNKLAVLLPEYAGDKYDPNSEARMITAKILYKEIRDLEVVDDYGKV